MRWWFLLVPFIGFLLFSSETLSKEGDKMSSVTITSSILSDTNPSPSGTIL
jgi:hypothetical protein